MWTVVVRDPTGKVHSKTPLKVGVVTIGRVNTCDIVLPSPAVSRVHGRLLVAEGDAPVYSDEKSANGSLIDGRAVVGAVDLGEKSVLMIGGFEIRLEREGSVRSADQTAQFSAADLASLAQKASPARPVAPAAVAPKPAAPMVSPPRPAAALPVPAAPSIPAAPAASAAPPRPAADFKSPLEGMQFMIPETPAATAQVGKVQHEKLADSMAHLLDQQIRGIQSRRTEVEQSARSKKEEFEQAWREAIAAARQLQDRVRGNPKIMYYVISRDEQEVSVKIADGSRRGYSNLLLSLRHPETGRVQEGISWLGILGEDSYAFKDPKEALEEFVRRIAGKVA